jgi:hypothetical protein
MVKVFVIIVLLAGWNPITGEKDLMIFPEPRFDTVELCLEFARANQEGIFYQTWSYYGPRKIEQVYCAPEETAKEYLKPIAVEPTPELET